MQIKTTIKVTNSEVKSYMTAVINVASVFVSKEEVSSIMTKFAGQDNILLETYIGSFGVTFDGDGIELSVDANLPEQVMVLIMDIYGGKDVISILTALKAMAPLFIGLKGTLTETNDALNKLHEDAKAEYDSTIEEDGDATTIPTPLVPIAVRPTNHEITSGLEGIPVSAADIVKHLAKSLDTKLTESRLEDLLDVCKLMSAGAHEIVEATDRAKQAIGYSEFIAHQFHIVATRTDIHILPVDYISLEILECELAVTVNHHQPNPILSVDRDLPVVAVSPKNTIIGLPVFYDVEIIHTISRSSPRHYLSQQS